LCLDWLASHDLDGLRVLDFGCGSGILALAACLLGSARVVAVDHDPQALLSTSDNASYNHVSEQQLVVRHSEEFSVDDPFDIVIANILVGPLVDLAQLFTRLLRTGGRIVLSGILANQVDQVVAAYPEVDFDAHEQDGDWVRLAGVRAA
jgi:ribosomal protein L11 methyltransferase